MQQPPALQHKSLFRLHCDTINYLSIYVCICLRLPRAWFVREGEREGRRVKQHSHSISRCLVFAKKAHESPFDYFSWHTSSALGKTKRGKEDVVVFSFPPGQFRFHSPPLPPSVVRMMQLTFFWHPKQRLILLHSNGSSRSSISTTHSDERKARCRATTTFLLAIINFIEKNKRGSCSSKKPYLKNRSSTDPNSTFIHHEKVAKRPLLASG